MTSWDHKTRTIVCVDCRRDVAVVYGEPVEEDVIEVFMEHLEESAPCSWIRFDVVLGDEELARYEYERGPACARLPD